MEKKSCVYILKCSDNSLYTGWTNEINRRVEAHNQGQGAKYTRGRSPVRLVYLEFLKDKSAGLKREAAIKRLSRKQKEKLIASNSNQL